MFVVLTVLGGCAITPRPGVPSSGPDTCNATQYQSLVGQDASAAQAVPQPKRVFHITDMVTMDFRAERLNVQLDDSGTIGAITCG
ncbi:MAG: I78 family peptidase inhibitor [Sulfitobacter sp.]